jgi:hypothetical protein
VTGGEPLTRPLGRQGPQVTGGEPLTRPLGSQGPQVTGGEPLTRPLGSQGPQVDLRARSSTFQPAGIPRLRHRNRGLPSSHGGGTGVVLSEEAGSEGLRTEGLRTEARPAEAEARTRA